MKVQIVKTKKLNRMLDEKKMQLIDFQNGILNIYTARGDENAMQNISLVLTQILSDNRDLALITMNTRNEQGGACVAIATFLSFMDIAYIIEDPGNYAYFHGLSNVCPPF